MATSSPDFSRATGESAHREWAAILSVCCLSLACEPRVVVGSCVSADVNNSDESTGALSKDAIPLPWTTGFENGFCGFVEAGGYCYSNKDASYVLVTSPVRTGRFAAAFNANGDSAYDGLQARCVRQGSLPSAAYYSAWFYLATVATSTDNWNLMHFQGEDDTQALHKLWDVSLGVQSDGSLRLYVFDHLRMMRRNATHVRAAPIASWFQIEVYLKRANDNTGEFTLFQDGDSLLDVTDVPTDDSQYGRWYIGNLAGTVSPPVSQLFIDDVSISETR